MEEKKNIPVGSPQELLRLESPTDRFPSEALKEARLRLDLLGEDFGKSDHVLAQIERFLSTPLKFDTAQRKVLHLIESVRIVTERAIENHQYLANNLGDIYRQAVELEKAVSETHGSIDARFTFWLHSFQFGAQGEEKLSREIPTFVEFLELVSEKHVNYAYFLVPFGLTPLLVCRYIPLDTNLGDFDADVVRFSTYVAPPAGSFRRLKRVWNKFFGSPNRSLLHLFHHSRPRSILGTFKRYSSVLMQPYRPYRHSEPNQLAKIAYDYINMYGMSGQHHVHLLKRDDKCGIFITQRPIQFDGRSVQLSDIDCPGNPPKGVHRLMIE